MKDVIEYQGRAYVSPALIAELYGVVRQTVYRWRRNKLLPAPVLVGGVTYYRRDAIESCLVRIK